MAFTHRLVVSALVVAASTPYILSIDSSAAATPTAAPPLPISASAALPPWARVYDVSGHHQVWLQPVLRSDEGGWDPSALLADANADLAWFDRMSHDRFSVSATRVLEPVRYEPADGGSACNDMVRAWASAHHAFVVQHLESVHLVGLTRVRDCPYVGIGETPGQSVVLTMMPTTPDVPAGPLIHELGHNLGLPHAAGYTGGQLSFSRQPPTGAETFEEYGDVTDVMGRADAAMPFGAATLAAAGWGEGVYVVPTADGAYGVDLPRVTAVGPDGMVVDDPLSGQRYLLAFQRAGAGTAPGVRRAGDGVYLYEVRRATTAPLIYGRESFTALMPWDASGLGAGAGTQWVSPSGAISVNIVRTSDTGAHLDVTVATQGGLSDSAGPSWPIPPTVRMSAHGDEARLEVAPAWDQSGVAGYLLTIGRGTRLVRLDLNVPSNILMRGFAAIHLKHRPQILTLTVTDTLGNTSTWTRRLRELAVTSGARSGGHVILAP